MAAQPSLPPSIESNYDMVKYFQIQSSPIKFDINNKEWVFTLNVDVDIAATAAKHIAIEGSKGALKGAALEGMTASIISIGGSLWKGALGGEIFLIEVAINAAKLGLKYGIMGAKHGAAVGVVNGVIKARAEIIYRAPYIRISRDDYLSNKNSRVLTALFKKVAGRDKICCPVSGRIFHVPLRTDCHAGNHRAIYHTFDSCVVINDLSSRNSIECPIDGCTKQLNHTNVTIDVAMRAKISDVIKRSLTWLVNQDSEQKDLTPEEREEIIDDLTDRDYLKGNEDQIVDKIQNRTLSGRDLRVLSNLVKNSIGEYNKSIDNVFRTLSRTLVKDMDKMDTHTLSTYQRHLIQWLDTFTISINERAQP